MYRVTFGCRAWRNSVFPLLFDRASALIFRRFFPSPCSRGFALIFFSSFLVRKKIVVRSTKHLLSTIDRIQEISVIKRNRSWKYEYQAVKNRLIASCAPIEKIASRIFRVEIELKREGCIFFFYRNRDKKSQVIRWCIFQGTLTDESQGYFEASLARKNGFISSPILELFPRVVAHPTRHTLL